MIKEIFTPIQERIQNSNLVKYVSEDWGQLEYYGKDCPVQWPCCIFDITSGNFSNIGNLKQEGEVTILFKVAHLRLTPNSGRTTTTQQTQSWEVANIVEQLHQLLHGYTPTHQQGRLIRKALRKIPRADGIKQYEITYTIGVHKV